MKEDKRHNTDLYDVASLTKILSTLPNVMLQYDQQNIKMETTLGSMLPIFKNSNKQDIQFKELSHYADYNLGFLFIKLRVDKTEPFRQILYKKESGGVSIKWLTVFIRNDYHDIIMKLIADSKLLPQKKYRYSDFIYHSERVFRKATGRKLDVLSTENFYKPLEQNNTMYNPLQRIARKE
jgi:CubicO group peptidase (beta-lactamase class C family)